MNTQVIYVDPDAYKNGETLTIRVEFAPSNQPVSELLDGAPDYSSDEDSESSCSIEEESESSLSEDEKESLSSCYESEMSVDESYEERMSLEEERVRDILRVVGKEDVVNKIEERKIEWREL